MYLTDITLGVCSLKNLAEFIVTGEKGLTKPVEDGDYDGLVDVMGHLMAVKDRQVATDEMFEPLKRTIELLKTYDQEMPDEVHQQLQVMLVIAGDICVKGRNTCVKAGNTCVTAGTTYM